MTIYIALLRGINVGARNRIKMADLKRAFEAEGLARVQTYIQSGNVLFASDEPQAALCARLEARMRTDFGIACTVVLRTAQELAQIIRDCPFTAEDIAQAQAATDAKCLYVAMQTSPPQAAIKSGELEGDRYHIAGRDTYLLLCRSILDSKLANRPQVWGAQATVRNWDTLVKLHQLAQDMAISQQ